MMNKKYFDQISGSQSDSTTNHDKKITKHILDAYIKEQPKEVIIENQRIGIKLEMNSYLEDESDQIIEAGEFLNKLLTLFNINKSKFAAFIGYENANLHALLKGRRKFNSKLASIMGEIFKIKPELWMFIEAKNELKKYNPSSKVKIKKNSLTELSYDR